MEERIVFGTPGVHSAWDLAAGNKTPVKSVCDGTVKKVSFKYSENVTDKNGGGGNQIYLECPIDEELTYTVIYAHLYPGTSKVKEGDSVKAGDELAGIGTTGYSTGPHLHYQVQVDGENVDGMSLIDFSDKKPPFNPGYNPGFNPGGLTPYNPNPNFPTRP
jgi:murein DD-endopeptidase MepM/ murein hydrolase activator NlpD